jgi:hypothetical protein
MGIDTVKWPFLDSDQVGNLHQAWQELCYRYLPVRPTASIWCYHRAPHPQDLEQGWKLHLPATVVNATSLMERVAPFLMGQGVQFKAPVTLQELNRINSGLYHGYSQVGKCITVYPRSTKEALTLADELHRLTYKMTAPVVPFDLRYRSDSNVYYRYGAFRRWMLDQPNTAPALALRDPQGKLVLDVRTNPAAKPDWVQNPFTNPVSPPPAEPTASPLKTTYRAFRALAQRGKGGVYQAIDLSQPSPRFCMLKEGRQHGELSWDGRDGYWRIKHEERVLTHLRASGLNVPQVYASFEVGSNYYLVTEFITGECLQTLLKRRQRRLTVAQALFYGSEMAATLAGIHAAGWVWRDCKPSNFISNRSGLRPIDFEGACPIDSPDPLPWSTPGFASPITRAANEARSSVYDDCYALGAAIYLLFTGRLPEPSRIVPVQKMRRGIPATAREVITALLLASPRRRPSAQGVCEQLQTALRESVVEAGVLEQDQQSASLGADGQITARRLDRSAMRNALPEPSPTMQTPALCHRAQRG